MQQESDLPKEIAELLYAPDAAEQLYTWLVPTDDVVDVVRTRQGARASNDQDGSLVRSSYSRQARMA